MSATAAGLAPTVATATADNQPEYVRWTVQLQGEGEKQKPGPGTKSKPEAKRGKPHTQLNDLKASEIAERGSTDNRRKRKRTTTQQQQQNDNLFYAMQNT